MGPIGGPEMIFIFFLAMILFGPKKLPELGRTVGKAIAEFQRAKSALEATLERETKQLGLDTDVLTDLANRYRVETMALEAASHEPYLGSAGPVCAAVADEPAVLPVAAAAEGVAA